MRKETQLGLLAFGMVGTVVGCGALLVALHPGSVTGEPQQTEENKAAIVAAPAVAQDPTKPEGHQVESNTSSLIAQGTSSEEDLSPLPTLAEPKRGESKPRLVEKDQPKAALPEFDSFQQTPREGRLTKSRPSGETEPIEIIRAYITERLSPGESLKIGIYSDPIPATFNRKKAVVLRVIYEIRDAKTTITKDQLFLLQDSEVKECVDFSTWYARLQRDLAIRAARIRAAQQAVAAVLAQQQAAQQAFANRMSSRPGNC